MKTISQNIQKFTQDIRIMGLYFIVVVSILIASFIYYNYLKEVSLTETSVLKKLNAVVKTAALQLDAKDHEYLLNRYQQRDAIATNEQDSVYHKIHKTLQQIADANNLTSTLYTLYREENTASHLHYLASSTNPFFLHTYDTPSTLLMALYDKGGEVHHYKDENGIWISAFTPIKNDQGETVCVLQADQRFDTFLYQAKKESILYLLNWFALWCIITFILFYVLKSLIESMQQNLSIEIINKELEIKVKHRTEELSQTNIQLQSANQQLKESNHKLGVFASVVSHDLKEPLRMMSGFSSLLQKRHGTNLDDNGKEYLGFISDGATRMTKMVEDLLNYAKINGRKPHFKPILLDELLQEVLFNLQVSIQQKGVDVQLDIPKIYVRGDKTLLSQLFQNLISNAIKFQNTAKPLVGIRVLEEGGELQVCIKDNGIGIPKEDFQRIFDMFTRLHGKGEYKGSGIGLNTCKRIVDRHQGQIWLDSELGKGTTFYIKLSKAAPEDAVKYLEQDTSFNRVVNQ